jgi:hypothetical protein
MVTFTDGTTTTDGTEQTLWDITADKYYGGFLFTHAMLAGDTVRVRVYVKDQNAALMRVLYDESPTGAQDPPAFFIAMVPTKQHKVTIQRTAGTDRAYTWQRAEQT